MPINDNQNNLFADLVDKIGSLKAKGENSILFEKEIENQLATRYLLSDEEKSLITS
jgi:hypothetical protein